MSASCPSKLVLGQFADWARWEAELGADPVELGSALVARLSQVQDLRRRMGVAVPVGVDPGVDGVRDAGSRLGLGGGDLAVGGGCPAGEAGPSGLGLSQPQPTCVDHASELRGYIV